MPKKTELLTFFVVIFLAMIAGIYNSTEGIDFSTLWLANGVSIAFLIDRSPKAWWPFLLAGFIANVISNFLILDSPLLINFLLSSFNTLEAAIAVLLLRFLVETGIFARYDSFPFEPFVISALFVAPVISASLAAFVTATSYSSEVISSNWIHWWVADALGALLATPLIVTLRQLWSSKNDVKASFSRMAEWGVNLGLLGFLSFHVFCSQTQSLRIHHYPFWTFPAMAWVGIRLGFKGAAIGFALVAFFGISDASRGYGVMGQIKTSSTSQVIALQLFLMCLATTVFMLTILFEERSAYTERLKLLYQRKTTVLEDERKRIAHELHDNLGQLLSALKMNLSSLQNSLSEELVVRKLGSALSLSDRAIANVRGLSKELLPPLLDTLGIGEALKQLAEDMSRSDSFSVIFKSDFYDVLNKNVSLALYRVAQEALTNAAKHSGSSTAHLSLEKRHGLAVLSVRDFGVGIKANLLERKGLGMMSMHERARGVGGMLSVQRLSNELGTLVQFTLQLDDMA